MRFGLVILNYKTSNEVRELINSIYNQKWRESIRIYIVDNSLEKEQLLKLVKTFNELDIKIIFNNKNLGFAKGNNIGIKQALNDGNDFIIISNPDIIIPKDDFFLEKVKKTYLNDFNIALIGPSIFNETNYNQNPLMKDRFDNKTILRKKIFFYLHLDIIYYFLRVYLLYNIVNFYKDKNKEKFKHIGEIESQYVYSLNGCFLIFTPTFFKFFEGFDNNTFMYCEEHILAEKLYKKNLKSYFNKDIQVLHKGGKSVAKDNDNFRKKLKFVLFNTLKSCKYFFTKVI